MERQILLIMEAKLLKLSCTVLLLICLIASCEASAKKCDKYAKHFEQCLKAGYFPKTIDGCNSEEAEIKNGKRKHCFRQEKRLKKRCNYSCVQGVYKYTAGKYHLTH